MRPHIMLTALTWPAPQVLDTCSTNLRVIFQKRCWSPSSAKRLPDDGSHSPDKRISTCIFNRYQNQSGRSCMAACISRPHQALAAAGLYGQFCRLCCMLQSLREGVRKHLKDSLHRLSSDMWSTLGTVRVAEHSTHIVSSAFCWCCDACRPSSCRCALNQDLRSRTLFRSILSSL